jgi:hypothetical protein
MRTTFLRDVCCGVGMMEPFDNIRCLTIARSTTTQQHTTITVLLACIVLELLSMRMIGCDLRNYVEVVMNSCTHVL